MRDLILNLPRHGRLLAVLHGRFAPPMNQIPKAVFSKRGSAILAAATTTQGLEDAQADARTSQTKVMQPGGESWAEAYVASGDLAEEIAKLKAQDGKRSSPTEVQASPAVSSLRG
jgi:hypothetical protein